MNRLFGWFRKSKSSSNQSTITKSFYQSIYPENVRYALQYREAQMGKEEILALLTSWYFEAVYLVMKTLGDDRKTQRQFLQDLTRLYYKDNWDVEELRDLLKRYIRLIPDGTTVTGTKLAQLSRAGLASWQNKWRDLAETALSEDPDALPCLVANTTIHGYHHFVRVYRDSGHDKLIFLMPNWILDPTESQMGYEISLRDPPIVTLQVKQECLYGSWTCEGKECPLHQHFCKEAIFIDDTLNTASTAGKLQSFWLSQYGLNMPLDRVHVITNLRENSHKNKIQRD